MGEWKPKGGVTEDGITPGRVGHVHFSPEATLDVLAGKPPGWLENTFGGQLANLDAPLDNRLAKEMRQTQKAALNLNF